MSKTVKELCPDKAKREARLQELKSRLKAGGVGSIVGELEPHHEVGEAVAKCIDYFKGNRERMRYDSCRKRGMKSGNRGNFPGIGSSLTGYSGTFGGFSR